MEQIVYYQVFRSWESEGSSHTSNELVCQTFDLQEVKEVHDLLMKEFEKEYNSGNGEPVSLNVENPSLEECDSIYYEDKGWISKPELTTITVKHINLYEKRN